MGEIPSDLKSILQDIIRRAIRGTDEKLLLGYQVGLSLWGVEVCDLEFHSDIRDESL
ncbi:hypothetical protein Elgi_56490 [Paenibacillus elgii]|nr:hypothetical protein Elgi_56490 [Paenibacillus elgii]